MKQYTVNGALYSTIAQYYDYDSRLQWPYYRRLESRSWTIEAESLEDAVAWLMTNYPSYYMGGSIVCITPGVQEFQCNAVPSIEYGEGNFETIEARIAYVKSMLRRKRRNIA